MAIEISNAHAEKVPADYIRRQTLVGAERYVTAELKEYEGRVLGAEERIARLELELFVEVRGQVSAHAEALLRAARAVGALDVLVGLADVAHERGHVRPDVDDSQALEIVDGRHPVLEAGAAAFTPNDLRLDPDRLPDHHPDRAQHERQERVHAPGRAPRDPGADRRASSRRARRPSGWSIAS